jgi:hypothetical protein
MFLGLGFLGWGGKPTPENTPLHHTYSLASQNKNHQNNSYGDGRISGPWEKRKKFVMIKFFSFVIIVEIRHWSNRSLIFFEIKK